MSIVYDHHWFLLATLHNSDKERNKTGREGGAKAGGIIMYNLVFEDVIPVYTIHYYQCQQYAGFTLYKTLQQWKQENPGIAGTLRPYRGANHYDPVKRARYLASSNLSAIQMSKTMIDDFFKTWEIIDHQANTSSGFSATLMKHKKTGKFTLSFRSTESKQSIDGGDVELNYSKEAT